jgi:formylglycine-generating enzyme required for sulfatase activity
MKRDCFKLRMRLMTLLFPLAAVLLLMIPSLGPNASAGIPQGKGGEVIAKPTPTPAPKKTTTKKRTPARNSSTSSPAKSAGDGATAAELIFWNSIKDSTNPDDFKVYLKKYPNGEFAELAKNRLKVLEAAKSSTIPNPTDSRMSNLPPSRTNQVGIVFILIPPGSFMMGSTNGRLNEKPVHQVTISQPFFMGEYEVTQAEWQTVMGNNPSYFKDCGGNCPVEQVSWDDAQKFINTLNESNDGFTYRLPSEAEWEYACRAGTTGDYAGNFNDIAWFSKNSGGSGPHAVGQKKPNAWGLFDMQGNVSEWCQDSYHETYFGAPTDGSAWLSGGDENLRIFRGGSWPYGEEMLRAATRAAFPRDYKAAHTNGFRVVATPRTSLSLTDSGSSSAKPPNSPLPLHSFDFVTVTLDNSGKLKNRETKSANAFAEDLGGVKLEMVAIPPGEFMMGSSDTDVQRSVQTAKRYDERAESWWFTNETPQHRVRINYWFYLGKYEVTLAQWRAIMGTNPSTFTGCDDCPVEQVSWNDAVEFCQKLSARTGREYRLPSEAEWEYAARAGTTTPFAFGETITPEIVNYNGDYPYGNAAKGTNREKTVPVGSLGVANAFGLYDMHGNVFEWCQDWYHNSYSAIAGEAPRDGSAWLAESGGEQKNRVMRGFSWSYGAQNVRSASRGGNPLGTRKDGIGIRVVAIVRTP